MAEGRFCLLLKILGDDFCSYCLIRKGSKISLNTERIADIDEDLMMQRNQPQLTVQCIFVLRRHLLPCICSWSFEKSQLVLDLSTWSHYPMP